LPKQTFGSIEMRSSRIFIGRFLQHRYKYLPGYITCAGCPYRITLPTGALDCDLPGPILPQISPFDTGQTLRCNQPSPHLVRYALGRTPVLPEPGPAMMSSGRPVCRMAWRCSDVR
jgi:hypothetical protein